MRFLALTLGGWSAVRVLMLWPPGALPVIPAAAAAGSVATPAPRPVEPAPPLPAPTFPARVVPPRAIGPGWTIPVTRRLVAAPDRSATGPRPVPAEPPVPVVGREDAGAIPPPLRPQPIAAGRSRLAGSAWLIARGGSGGTLLGGQLGGSQAGARLTYALGATRRFALSARVATPLRGRGREAAFGLDWQPTRAPVHLLAEQRVSLDGGRGGPTLMAVGGLAPSRLVAGFDLEAYAQAGVIARGGAEVFGDGAARVTRRIATVGGLRLDLGIGAWGAAQRDARRLDVGPTLGLVVPLAGRAARLTLDWRERVAGNARPGSGPALSLGTDF